jgi:iron(III) transport system substrate-binding protein
MRSRSTRPRPASPLRTVFAVLLLLVGLAGCREGREDGAAAAGLAAPEAAADDGPLRIYSGRSRELMTPLFERFERQSGIAVEVRWGGSDELAAALLAEGTATPADLFLSRGAAPLGGLSRKGLLRELPVELVRGVPAQFAGGEQKHDWAGLSGRARAVIYDVH